MQRCNYHNPAEARELATPQSRGERLTFRSRPCLEHHTWEHGTMDIAVFYYGFPFAYMVVVDGVMNKETVYRDTQWHTDCYPHTISGRTIGGSGCIEGNILRYLIDDDLRTLLKPEIVAGCTAVVAAEYP